MRAIVLISGGLDSLLAIKAIQKQGIEVLAINFLIPFLKDDLANNSIFFVKKITEQLGCKCKVITLAEDYLDMVKNPKYGYGKNFNPCIDCKILMLKKAKNVMSEFKASFIATGEVLGQRPMSQHKQALKRIEEASSLNGLLLRPLSALLLAPTIPQKKGWVKKELLFDIHGRGRRRQISLAKEWGVEDYPWPGGGCLLTDSNFCKRLKDLLKYDQLSIEDITLLKLGRHFRITSKFKLIVGRDKEENEKLISLAKKGDVFFEPKKMSGPTGISKGPVGQRLKDIAARIIARYTCLDKKVEIVCGTVSKRNQELILVKGMNDQQLKKWII
ncbi:MAG: hypothetical protein KAS05_02635 [Candidatus Omnitrophica bacterium]|nr:hypothetical protein [Candidatus Omnitrophota bacterium]